MPKPLKFLLVGQSADGRALLGRTLIDQFPQAAAIECADHDTAVHLAKSGIFNAVVIQGETGEHAQTLVRSIRQVNSSVPVVIASDDDRSSETAAAGADCFLPRDRWPTLGAVVTELLRAHRPLRTHGGGATKAAGLSVVVVDDVQEITAVIREWLSNAGHSVATASSAAAARALVGDAQVDLVITDVLMPEHDGLDLIRDLQRTHPTTRILAISGGGRYMEGLNCLRMARGFGAHAALAKPFSETQLMEAVEAAMAPDEQADRHVL